MTTSARAARPANVPAAYLITITCYGARLHGDPKGSTDRYHNVPGSPFVDASPNRQIVERRRMASPPAFLDDRRRQIVLDAVERHAVYRGWPLHAAHVRSNHFHIVVQAPIAPERVMLEFKAYATRALNQYENASRRRWSHHGSTRYLWDDNQVEDAVNYVVHQQGTPMALYVNPNLQLRHPADAHRECAEPPR